MAVNPIPKFMVLSIDGVPFGMLTRLLQEGVMPHLAQLVEQTGMQPMRSVQPTVSCVAWSSYMTGCNPGKHGVFGFIDRRAGSYDLSFPNSRMMAVEHIWVSGIRLGIITEIHLTVPSCFLELMGSSDWNMHSWIFRYRWDWIGSPA